jgi:hypothetical protein
MKELTFEEQLVEDINILTTEKLFEKAASHGIPMNNLFGILAKVLRAKYAEAYHTAAFKKAIRTVLEEHAYEFTAKEMSFLTNHTLDTLILEDKIFKKQ